MSLLNFFKKEKNPLLGIYGKNDLAIIIAMMLGVTSIIFITINKNLLAFIFLFVCGILHIASRFLNNKKADKFQNIYILILEGCSSVVCFGVTPALATLYLIGFNHLSTLIIAGLYIIATVISVAYNLARDINRDSYALNIGLPVTVISILYPILYFINFLFGFVYFDIAMTISLLLVGIFYLLPIRINKITKK